MLVAALYWARARSGPARHKAMLARIAPSSAVLARPRFIDHKPQRPIASRHFTGGSFRAAIRCSGTRRSLRKEIRRTLTRVAVFLVFRRRISLISRGARMDNAANRSFEEISRYPWAAPEYETWGLWTTVQPAWRFCGSSARRKRT